MKEPRSRKILAGGLAILAAALLVMGGRTSYEISPDEIEFLPSPQLIDPVTGQPPLSIPTPFGQPSIPPPPEPPKVIPNEISDVDLVVNATFTGIVKHDGTLFWTYDPTEKRGKRACPT